MFMDEITVVLVEVVLMPNGELIHMGKSLGFAEDRSITEVKNKSYRRAKGGEPIINIKVNK